MQRKRERRVDLEDENERPPPPPAPFSPLSNPPPASTTPALAPSIAHFNLCFSLCCFCNNPTGNTAYSWLPKWLGGGGGGNDGGFGSTIPGGHVGQRSSVVWGRLSSSDVASYR